MNWPNRQYFPAVELRKKFVPSYPYFAKPRLCFVVLHPSTFINGCREHQFIRDFDLGGDEGDHLSSFAEYFQCKYRPSQIIDKIRHYN